MIPETLNQEIEDLRETGYAIAVQEEGDWAKLIISKFPLPDGYSKQNTDLLLLVPKSYPNGKPDMFWVEEDVVLGNDQVPQKADIIEQHLGKRWRRFSWHTGNHWNPGRDNLYTYLCFVENGLLQARNK